MRRIERLKREARKTFKARGHFNPFFINHSSTLAELSCLQCGMFVMVNLKHLPHEAEVSGHAMRVNCDHGLIYGRKRRKKT